MDEMLEPEVKPELAVELHDLLEVVAVLRLAVRAEPHHFVFVAVLPEAQILRQRRVEDSERVRKSDRAIDRELIAASDSPHAAGEISQPVDRQQRRFVKRRNEKRAREMRLVVLDPMYLRL